MPLRFRVLLQVVSRRTQFGHGYNVFDRFDCADVQIEPGPLGTSFTGFDEFGEEAFQIVVQKDGVEPLYYPITTGPVLIYDRDQRRFDHYPKDY